ncbi:response regulator receiver sensor signal transduction histidine kinase [Leptolyngbya sp. NIES-3755]|nr:response regulator receiver sensor signal transduction histidine kinase [Leptolyngbya sp. NIES-3755]
MTPSQAILIVDDNPTNLQVLSEALTIAGFQVAVATSGERAIKQARYRLPELILMDIMMPEMDGFEACRQLKCDTLTQQVPLIFMTALSDTDSKIRGFSLGAVDYITKPFQQEEVIARVRTHLQLRNFARTLETQNDRLKQEIEQREKAETDLRQTQSQLIHSEKMSSLGQLVAGIAHEINNPINFIHGNLNHTETYTQDLLRLVQAYQSQYPEPNESVEIIAEDIDLDFLVADFPKIIRSMQTGADRIREIVTSLRTFSRLDEAEVKAADLHEGLDSTLMILRHRLEATSKHPEIEVFKQYDPLPRIECYAGQLNQVFMHLMSNAIDSLELRCTESDPTWTPAIWIQTRLLDSEHVEIRITDNGVGIPEAILEQIFDPFFTTKPIGQGTGMGLAIAYQIVSQTHQGKLFCSSSPEKTEFVIQIPVCQYTT